MFKRTTAFRTAAAVSLFGLAALTANAQTLQGQLGATSTGQLDLDLEVTDSVEITSLNSIDLGSYGGGDTGGINSGDAFCVYVHGGDGYTITPTSSNGSFNMIGTTGGDQIEYSVKLVGAASGASSANSLTYNNSTSTFTGSRLRDCGGNNNASVDISIQEQEIRDASTDTYADTLILLVNPV